MVTKKPKTFWTDYLNFKEEAIEQGIWDINEIIKLFGVWIKRD